jgi:hypothetical protein
MTRTTTEVLEDHLRRRADGDLDGDLEHNYSAGVVLLCEHGPRVGREAIRTSAEELERQIPSASFEYPVKVVEEEYALLFWRADSANARAEHGVDSFVVRDGRIVLQTVAYELEPKK